MKSESPAPRKCKINRVIAWNAIVAGFLLLIAIVLVYPVINLRRESPYVPRGKNEVTEIVVAVRNYEVEYGYYPLTDGFSKRDLTLSTNNHELFDILRNIPNPPYPGNPKNNVHNRRGIIFIEVPDSRSTPPKSGLGPDGTFYDPWGTPYSVRIDANYDGMVKNPLAGEGNPGILKAGVIAWSFGKDGGVSAVQ